MASISQFLQGFSLHKYFMFQYIYLLFRYTIVMVYYAFCLVLMMIIRPLLSTQFVNKKGSKSIYAALYFLPILTVVQAICGGLLCKLIIFYVHSTCLCITAIFISRHRPSNSNFGYFWRRGHGRLQICGIFAFPGIDTYILSYKESWFDSTTHIQLSKPH
jgi:hypothetical protein